MYFPLNNHKLAGWPEQTSGSLQQTYMEENKAMHE